MAQTQNLTTTMVHSRLPVQLVKELAALAKRIGKTRAQVVRDALVQHLADDRTASRLESQHAQTLAALAAANKRSEESAAQMLDTLTVIAEQNQEIIKTLAR